MTELSIEYINWLFDLKSKIRSAQAKASIKVNTALIEFYWDLGKMIAEKDTGYGTGFLDQVSRDLKAEFPDMQGLSSRNLKYTRQFYTFYKQTIEHTLIRQQAVAELEVSDEIAQQHDINKFVKQAVGQIPWGHNILIFSKSESIKEAHFYLAQTIENAWSRDVLA